MLNNFLWGIFPYIVFSIFFGGIIIRYAFFESNWTAKSSEFLDKSGLKHNMPIFHAALLMVIVGHISGILVPEYVTAALGISEHTYHLGAVYGGAIGGTLLLVTFVVLMIRRFTNDRLKVNTSSMDKVLYIALTIAIFSGYSCMIQQIFEPYNYRLTIGPWFRSLMIFQPEVNLMSDIPTIFKAHMLGWMTVALVFPFTRLVHCLSFPFKYIGRRDIVYRKK